MPYHVTRERGDFYVARRVASQSRDDFAFVDELPKITGEESVNADSRRVAVDIVRDDEILELTKIYPQLPLTAMRKVAERASRSRGTTRGDYIQVNLGEITLREAADGELRMGAAILDEENEQMGRERQEIAKDFSEVIDQEVILEPIAQFYLDFAGVLISNGNPNIMAAFRFTQENAPEQTDLFSASPRNVHDQEM